MGKGNFFSDDNANIVLQNDDKTITLWDMVGTAVLECGMVANPAAALAR